MLERSSNAQARLTVLTTRIPTAIFNEQLVPYIKSQGQRASWQSVSLDALMTVLERDPLLLPRFPYRFPRQTSTVQTTRIPVWLRDDKIMPFLGERQAADMPATQQWLMIEAISQFTGIDFPNGPIARRRPQSAVWLPKNVIQN